MTLEQWEAAQASVAADEAVEEARSPRRSTPTWPRRSRRPTRPIAEAQVDAEEAPGVEIDQADMSLGGEAVEGDDPDAPLPRPARSAGGVIPPGTRDV